VNYDNSLVVTTTVTGYSWTPSSGDYLFTCGAIYRPPHLRDRHLAQTSWPRPGSSRPRLETSHFSDGN